MHVRQLLGPVARLSSHVAYHVSTSPEIHTEWPAHAVLGFRKNYSSPMESSCPRPVTSLLNKELEAYILLEKLTLLTKSPTLSTLAQNTWAESIQSSRQRPKSPSRWSQTFLAINLLSHVTRRPGQREVYLSFADCNSNNSSSVYTQGERSYCFAQCWTGFWSVALLKGWIVN